MQIKNFAKLEYITAFELVKHECRHSHLNFTASVVEGGEGNFFACVGKIISVALDNGMPIFYGRVETVEIEKAFNAMRVHVSCVSLSIATDEQTKTRIFHAPDKNISDVLNQSRLALEQCGLKVSNELGAKKYDGAVLQNQETNFKFIARLAKALNSRVWVVDTMSKAEICLDKCLSSAPRKIAAKQLINIRHGRSTMTVRTEDYFDLGLTVTVETTTRDVTEYVIVGLRADFENERYIFTYELEEKEPAPAVKTKEPTLAKAMKLHATVKSVDDPKHLGRIQVQFDDEFIEDMDQKNPLWLEYRSPYGGANGGIVFLPDEGDAVEVMFCNEELYAVSTLRTNALNKECQDVVEKYIGNNFEQRIFWKKKSLEMWSGENKIVMNDKGIELTVGKSKIIMTDKEIKFECGELTAKSSGGAKISAGGTLKLSGSKIEMC